MRGPEELYIPCEGFEVELRLSSDTGLSPIERLVLEAIHAGENEFRPLTDMFQLSERPMLDLLLELWQRGYVVIDTETGGIALTAEVAEKVGRQDFSEMEGGRVRLERLELFTERISGHILPSVPWGEGLRQGRIVEPVQPDGAWRNASRAELTQAIRYRVERMKDPKQSLAGSSPLRLIDFSLPSPVADGRPSGRIRFLRLEVRCIRGAHELLQIDVVGPSEVPAMLRQTLGVELTRLAARRRKEPVFKALLENLDQEEDLTVVSLTAAFDEFEKELERLRTQTTLPAQAADRHDRLVDRAFRVARLLDERSAQQGQLHLLEKGQHGQWIEEAIQQARAQVVVAFPTIRYDRLVRLLPLMQSALARGVQIVVLWGQKREEQLEVSVRNAFQELTHLSYGFHWSSLSSRLNARYVAVDGARLLVTTALTLGHEGGRLLELGWVFQRNPEKFKLSADTTSLMANPCLSALLVSRDLMPDYRAAREILTAPDDFADLYRDSDLVPASSAISSRQAYGEGVSGAGDSSEPPLPRSLRPDEDDAESVEGQQHWTPEYRQADLQLWRSSWDDYLQHLQARREGLGCSSALLKDSDHILRLWLRLNQAQRYLVIASPRLTRAAVSPRLLRKIEARLDAGDLQVTIIHSKEVEAGLDIKLRELEKQFPSRFQLVHHPHAMNLLLDSGEATLTSFPLLSFDEVALEMGRGRADIGLIVREASFCQDVLAWLRAQIPAVFPVAAIGSERKPAAPGTKLRHPGAGSIHLRRLLDDIGAYRSHLSSAKSVHPAGGVHSGSRAATNSDDFIARKIEEWADRRDVDSIAADLSILKDLPIPNEDRARILAVGVTSIWDQRLHECAQNALSWIIEWLWHMSESSPSWRHPRAMEAALLLPELLIHNESLPSTELALLVSAYCPKRHLSQVGLEQIWADLSTALRNQPLMRDATTVVACAAVLEGQPAGAFGWLDALPTESPEALRSLTQLVQDLYKRSSPEETLDQAFRVETVLTAEHEWERARLELLAALERAKSLKFYYTFGRKVWQLLHKKGSLLGQIFDAANSRNISKLKELLNNIRGQQISATSLIIRACAAVDPFVNSRTGEIDGDKLDPCVQRINRVFRSMAKWQESDDQLNRVRQARRWDRDALNHGRKRSKALEQLAVLAQSWDCSRHPGLPLLCALRASIPNRSTKDE